MSKKRNIFARIIVGFFSTALSVLAMPPVRNFLWGKMVGKGKEKVIDAEARIVKEDRKGLFK